MGFQEEYLYIASMLAEAPVVDVGEWQGIHADIPQAKTIELEDITLLLEIPEAMEDLQDEVRPNLPWAEEHFQERVSGTPYNPPPSHVNWPFAQKSNEEHMSDNVFSHTYPERMWPKFPATKWDSMQGIRYPYGDLNDVVALLKKSPHTRQAYLPIWFPEDTGAVDGQRVPCSLGYHFMIRDGKMKVVYYIRSCDFFRHFNDDVYMAERLGQWVAEKVGVVPERLIMHISSMHIFSVERERVAALAEQTQ